MHKKPAAEWGGGGVGFTLGAFGAAQVQVGGCLGELGTTLDRKSKTPEFRSQL